MLISMPKTPQNRTVVSHHAVSQGGAGTRHRHPPFDGSALPQWIQSVLQQNGGFKSNRTMECIGKYTQWLSGLLAGKALVVEHVTHMYCPVMLCQDILKVHEHNGTILGVDPVEPGTVYVRCCYCKRMPRPANESIRLLEGVWLILTEESLSKIGGHVSSGGCCAVDVFCVVLSKC